MNQIMEFISNITTTQIIDIVIALCIVILFRMLSSSLAYAVIKIFKIKTKNSKKIKDSAIYLPLKILFIILGVYMGILFIRKPLNISQEFMNGIKTVLKIITTIAVANGLAQSFNRKSTLIVEVKKKINKDVDDSMLNFILKITRATIYIIAGFIVITQLGINLNGLVAGLGISGVIVTLAAQDTAKNLFGGLVIFLDKPFIVGDWIQLDKYEGTVEDITFRSTRVRTFENSLVNIPNSTIANESIINWSKMEKRRVKMKLCLELTTPIEKIESLRERIYKTLLKHEQIVDDTIIVRVDEIADNGINLLISSYTDSINYESYLKEKETINYKIIQILREEKIELTYDTKTVYVKN